MSKNDPTAPAKITEDSTAFEVPPGEVSWPKLVALRSTVPETLLNGAEIPLVFKATSRSENA